jgi:hypothetical protein
MVSFQLAEQVTLNAFLVIFESVIDRGSPVIRHTRRASRDHVWDLAAKWMDALRQHHARESRKG